MVIHLLCVPPGFFGIQQYVLLGSKGTCLHYYSNNLENSTNFVSAALSRNEKGIGVASGKPKSRSGTSEPKNEPAEGAIAKDDAYHDADPSTIVPDAVTVVI